MNPVLLEVRDRFAASDPGYGRLRTGLSAAVSVASALPVQQLVGRVLGFEGQTAFAATLFGAVVAMLGSNALSGSDRWAKVRTAVFFPVAVGLGLVGAAASDSRRLLQVVGFGLVLFLAVWVRRFGPDFFYYGFMAWMGFFFATFLRADWSVVPELLVAAVASSVWVVVLSTVVFHTDARRVLRTTRQAFYAQGRTVARECADLLMLPASSVRRRDRALRALSSRRSRMAETALLAEAWSVEPGAVPDGWSAPALRRRLIEAQQAMERVAGSSVRLQRCDRRILVDQAREVVNLLAHHDDVGALLACERLDRLAQEDRDAGGDDWWPARHLAYAVREFLRFDAAVDDPPEVDPGEDDFEAATGLVFGGLPGAPAVARDVRARGRWNPLVRASMSTRQAVQVAVAGVLALGVGTLLSPTRYYWAVIAAFVLFTGTGTRSETFIKGSARVGGTLLGLVAAILLAHVTAGSTPVVLAVIIVSVFFAFYLAKVSQTAMTFFITVLLGQMYTVLGTYSDTVLVLRLGETVVGALAGVAVAMLFAPLSTRDTVRSARDEMLEAMGELLEAVAQYAESPVGRRPQLDGLTRALDDRARRLALVARPLTRPLVLGNSSPRTRQRLLLYIAGVSQCRALTLSLQARPVEAPEAVATAARALARAVESLAAQEPGAEVPDAEEPLDHGSIALFGAPGAARDDDPVVRHLHHLGATLTQVARTTAREAPVRHRS